MPGHAVAQHMALDQSEVAHQVPGCVQRRIVVQQADPERRQRADPRPRPAVGTAHLQELLQPHFREGGGEVVGPVAQGRQHARQHVQLAAQELAERLAGRVDVDPVAIGEIHRHVEHVVDVALVAEAVLEHEVEHAGAVRIGVGPDVRAVAEVAVGPAFGERRIGEQRRGHRLQRQRDAELLHHVRFVGVVQVDLHRAGAGHHVQAQVADPGHVVAHDPVAALGHPGHVGARPFGLEAHAQEAQLQLVGDLAHLVEVGAGFHAGLVDVLQCRAGQFQLPGRLQRHRGAIADQGDGAGGVAVHALAYRGPAEAHQAFEQGLDAAFAVEGRRTQVIQAEAELLVLGADAPVGLGLPAGGEVIDQLVAPGDRRVGGMAGTRQGWLVVGPRGAGGTRTISRRHGGPVRQSHAGARRACDPLPWHR